MSVLAHLNLVVKQIINRNYWTRVIIFSDAAFAGFCDILDYGRFMRPILPVCCRLN